MEPKGTGKPLPVYGDNFLQFMKYLRKAELCVYSRRMSSIVECGFYRQKCHVSVRISPHDFFPNCCSSFFAQPILQTPDMF